MRVDYSRKNNVNFQRALTSSEKDEYKKILKDAKDELAIEDTNAIVFDFNVPSKKGANTAIGTSWSKNGAEFFDFLKTMTGINSIQLQPQGQIIPDAPSPYSGTNFALGEHIIDLNLLTTKEYDNLLDKNYVKNIDSNYPENKIKREYKTNYDYALKNQNKALKKAYKNFKNSDNKLESEYKKFKKENKFWLDWENIFHILVKEYGTDDINQWSTIDYNLFNSDYPENLRKKRIAEIKEKNKNELDYLTFVQFIADKQQKNSRKLNSRNDIKLYGDCLIGFSKSEMWGNKACFKDNEFYGATESSWGVSAPDYSKIGECDGNDISKLGETGKFLYDCFVKFFERYDGIRVDAAWQFVTPILYDRSGKRLEGASSGVEMTVFNIINAAAKKVYGDKFNENNPENIMVEMIGRASQEGKELTKNIYPQLYTSLLSEWDYNPHKLGQEGYESGKYYMGNSCHDNETLVNCARNIDLRESHFREMRNDYNLDEDSLGYDLEEYQNISGEEKRQEDFKNAKFGEIFTTKKQFYTLPDMFGMEERINISGVVSSDNWKVRIPSDYEEFYYSQLQNGYGLNMPKALAVALKMKQKNPYLYNKLNELASILRQKGPKTTKEADKLDKNGELGRTFSYTI